jgi:hypothetical protein
LWDKLIERRVNAHEKVIGIALEMRVFVLFDGIDSKGETKRYPKILHSEDIFNEWLCKFAEIGNNSSTWLSIHTKRELNYTQDYLLTLNNNIKNIPPEKLHEFGNLIRNDFIEISSHLEKEAYDFFEKDVVKLKLSSLDAWHKYPKPITLERLHKTELIKFVNSKQ